MLDLRSSVLCCLAKTAAAQAKNDKFLINDSVLLKNLKKLFLFSLALDGDCSPLFVTKKNIADIKRGVKEICGGNCCNDCTDSQIIVFQPDDWIDKVIKICTPTTTTTTSTTSTTSTTTSTTTWNSSSTTTASLTTTTSATATDAGIDFDFSTDCVDPNKTLAVYVFNIVRAIPPLQVRIDGGAWISFTDTYLFTGLSNGSHTVTIKDVLNRTVSKTFTRVCVTTSTTSTSTTTSPCPSGYTYVGGVCVLVTTSSTSSTSSTTSSSTSSSSTFAADASFKEKKFTWNPTTDFTNYDPTTKIPQFDMTGDLPVIFDGGNGTLGGMFKPDWQFWKSGFTAITPRTYTLQEQNRFASLSDDLKAFEMSEQEVFYEPLRLLVDTDCLCSGEPCWANVFDPEWAEIVTRINTLFSWNVLAKKAKHICINLERIDYKPSYAMIVEKRNCLENGRYSTDSIDTAWNTKSNDYFVNAYRSARAEYFIRFFNEMKLSLDNFNVKAQMEGVGSMAAYIYSGTPENLLMSGSGVDIWTAGSQSGSLGAYFDYQDNGILYMGEPFNNLNDSKVLTEILAHYESQIRNDTRDKPVVNHIKPFRENVTGQEFGNCEKCNYASSSTQISQGFAIIPFFLRCGSWLWGTAPKSEFGSSYENFIAGRYLCSQVKDIVIGGERVKPEIRLQGDSQWYGDSTSWINAVTSNNPNRYTGWLIQEKATNSIAFPLVVAVKKGNTFAFAATRIGGLDSGTTIFDLRITLPNGVKTGTFTVKNRDWIVYEFS